MANIDRALAADVLDVLGRLRRGEDVKAVLDSSAIASKVRAGMRESPKVEHLVVQEGGSSSEWYVSWHGTKSAAARFRRSCSKGAYRTSGPIQVPVSLLSHPEFARVAEDLARAHLTVEC